MRRTLLAALAAVAAAGLVPATARAQSEPCVPGTTEPTCRSWVGKVTFIADGDTIYVAHRGQRRGVPVRITGIQAMEQTVYSANPAARRGDCGAVAATDRLQRLISSSHGRVRISAQDEDSSSHGRLLRSVAVRIGGAWRDVGAIMLTEGHALWWPSRAEWAWNGTYSVFSQRAAAAHVGLFDTHECGIGPSANAPLRVWVDARGGAAGEWVRIENPDPVNAVPLDGWELRDSSLNRYRFPADAIIPPAGTITVYVRPGPTTPGIYRWGVTRSIFNNPTDDERVNGDGAYLLDPLGNLRAWSIYPCRVDCTDPLQGSVELGVHPLEPAEYVTIANVGSAPIDLAGYEITSGRHSYAFGSGAIVQPGEVLAVDVGGDPADDTPLDKHWDSRRWVLPNDAGVVRLESFTGISVACSAWGDSTC